MFTSHEVQTNRVNIGSREFTITLMRLSNGCFAVVSEGTKPKLGSVVLAVKTAGRAVSSTVLVSRWDALLSKMAAELLADRLNGIALVSAFMEAELESQAIRRLLAEVDSLAQG